VSGKVEELRNSVMGIINGILDWLRGIPSQMVQIGRNIIQGLANGIKNAAGAVTSAVTGAVQGAVNSAKSWLGISSESKLFKGFGVNVGEGFIGGISSKAGDVAQAMEAMVSAGDVAGRVDITPDIVVSGAETPRDLSGMWDTVQSLFQGGSEGAIAALRETFGAASEFIESSWGSITTLFSDAWNNIGEVFSSALESIDSQVRGAFEAVSDFIADIWNNIGEVFGGAFEWIQTLAKDAMGMLRGIFTGDMYLILSNLNHILIAFFGDFGNTIMEFVFKAVDYVSDFGENMRELFSTLWNNLLTNATDALGAISDGVMLGLETVKEVVTTGLESIAEFFRVAWGEIQSVVSDIMLSMRESIVGALNQVLENVAGWGAQIIERAREIGQRLIEGFMSVVGALPDMVQDIFSGIVRRILNAGSQLLDAAKQAGQRIWEGVKSGLGMSSPGHIERAIDAIVARADKMPSEMGDAFRRLSGLEQLMPEFEVPISTRMDAMRAAPAAAVAGAPGAAVPLPGAFSPAGLQELLQRRESSGLGDAGTGTLPEVKIINQINVESLQVRKPEDVEEIAEQLKEKIHALQQEIRVDKIADELYKHKKQRERGV